MQFDKIFILSFISLFIFTLSCTKGTESNNELSKLDLKKLRPIDSLVKEKIKKYDKETTSHYLDSLVQTNYFENRLIVQEYFKILLISYSPTNKPEAKLTLLRALPNTNSPINSSAYLLHKNSKAIALELQNLQKYKLAIEELKNSLVFIEKNQDLFYHEISSTYMRIAYIASGFTKEYEKSYESNKRAADLYVQYEDFPYASRAIYNTGICSLREPDYEKAEACFKQGLNYAMETNDYGNALNLHYTGLISLYSETKDMDSMDRVLAIVDGLFESEKVSKEEYYNFLVYAIDAYSSLQEYGLLNRKFESLEEHFKDTENPQTLKFIYNSKVHLEKISGSTENVKKYLLLNLKNVKGLQSDGVHRASSMKEILVQLIELAEKEKDIKSLLKWHKEKDVIQERWIDLVEEKNEAFKTQSELWSQKDLEYAQKEVRLEKEKTKNIRIVLLIFMIFSIGLIYLIYKVNSFAKLLKQQKEIISTTNESLLVNNNSLKEKNGIINVQNERLSKLLRQLKNTNDALNTSLTNLEEANTNLEKFAQIAAHDIKAPLRTIRSFTQIIKKKYYATILDKDKELFDFVINGAAKLSELITGLLQFSSLTQGLPEEQEINLNDTVHLIKKQLEFNSKQNNASINIASELPTIQSHPTLIDQLLLNILNNSIKYSKKDEHNFIEVFHKEEVDFITISIKDNGIGIPKDHQTEIFQFLIKLHDSREYEGSGIGLATCKKIVEYLGGEISVESELGKGTTMSFTLKK